MADSKRHTFNLVLTLLDAQPLIYHLTRHFVLARVICWRIFTRKLQSKHGNFLFFRAGQKIFLLIISDLKNIFKNNYSNTCVYHIHDVYLYYQFKTRAKWNTQQNKSKTQKETTTQC